MTEQEFAEQVSGAAEFAATAAAAFGGVAAMTALSKKARQRAELAPSGPWNAVAYWIDEHIKIAIGSFEKLINE